MVDGAWASAPKNSKPSGIKWSVGIPTVVDYARPCHGKSVFQCYPLCSFFIVFLPFYSMYLCLHPFNVSWYFC
jgi:hypothetical protein